MKKYAVQIKDAFMKGLRADSREPRGRELLESCVDLKPSPWGLVITDDFASPYTETIVGNTLSSLRKIVDVVNDTSRADDTDWTLESQWEYDSDNTEMDRTPGSGAPILGPDLFSSVNDSTFSGGNLGNWIPGSSDVLYSATGGSGGGGSARFRPSASTPVNLTLDDQYLSAAIKAATSYQLQLYYNVTDATGTYHFILNGAITDGVALDVADTFIDASSASSGTASVTLTTGGSVTASGLKIYRSGTGSAGYPNGYIDDIYFKEITGYSPAGPDTLNLPDANLNEALVEGRTYYLYFTVDNYVAGSVTADLSGTAGTARTADGTYFEAIVAGADGTGLTFTASTDFEGTIDISDVHIYYLADQVWPHPQIFRGSEQTVILWEDLAGIINEATWTNSQQTVLDAEDGTTPKAISDGTGLPWHFADLGNAWAATNGQDMLTRVGTGSVLTFDEQGINSVCAHRGRTFMLGLDDWPAAWKTAFQKLAEDDSQLSHTMTLGKNSLVWSAVGESFGSPWWLASSLADTLTSSGYSVGSNTAREAIHALMRNDWGFARLPFSGEGLAVVPLGKAVICFGENGVVAVVPHVDPVPTMQVVQFPKLMRVGLKSRSAWALNAGDGSDQSGEIIFVDNKDYLWHIDTQLQPERIGYQEYFAAMTGGTLVGSYHPDEDEFIFADGVDSFLLARNGLTQLEQGYISSIFVDESGATYATIDPDEVIDSDCEFTTQPTDFTSPGQKCTFQIYARYQGMTDPEVAVSYRFKPDESWATTAYYPLNNEGVTYLRAAGNEFKFHFKGEPDSTGQVEYMVVEWEQHDRRFVRSFESSQASRRG